MRRHTPLPAAGQGARPWCALPNTYYDNCCVLYRIGDDDMALIAEVEAICMPIRKENSHRDITSDGLFSVGT